MERRAAAERERRLEARVAEDVEQGEGDDEVLLDVVVVGPGRDRAPADDVDLREHRSVRLGLGVDEDVPAASRTARRDRRARRG